VQPRQKRSSVRKPRLYALKQLMVDSIIRPQQCVSKGRSIGRAVAFEHYATQAQQRRAQQIRQEEVQLQQGLYGEIVAVVKDKAKNGGFDFAFDKSGLGITQVPVLLYYKDATDFTDEVIVELNKNAPADSGKKEEPKKEEAPAKKSK